MNNEAYGAIFGAIFCAVIAIAFFLSEVVFKQPAQQTKPEPKRSGITVSIKQYGTPAPIIPNTPPPKNVVKVDKNQAIIVNCYRAGITMRWKTLVQYTSDGQRVEKDGKLGTPGEIVTIKRGWL